MKRLFAPAAAGLIVAAVVVMVLLTEAGSTPGYSTSPTAWVLPKLEGDGTLSLREFRGKPLVVDFFASWCIPCRSELPEFLAVSRAVRGRVAFVGVDSQEDGDGTGLARQTGITVWPLARDVGGSEQNGLREALETIPGMPVTAFYDSSGHVAAVRFGAMTSAVLQANLHQLFGVTARSS